MHSVRTILSCLLVVFISLSACNRGEVVQPESRPDTRFYPLSEGMVQYYSIKKIIIDAPISVYDTAEYILRNEYFYQGQNEQNDSVFNVKQSVMMKGEADYSFYLNCFAWINSAKAFWQQDNNLFYKLSFPLSLGETWNENLYNRLDTNSIFEARVEEFDQPYTLIGKDFSKTVLIESINQESIIHKKYYTERYAYGIGLIEKTIIDIDSQDEDISLPIEKRITTGIIYSQKLLP